MTSVASVAQELASELSAYLSPVQAQFAWVPEWQLGDADDMLCAVVPASVELSNVTRGATQRDYAIHVGVMQRVNPEDASAVRSHHEKLQDILEWTEGRKIDGASWKASRMIVAVDPDRLRTMRVFLGIIEVVYADWSMR